MLGREWFFSCLWPLACFGCPSGVWGFVCCSLRLGSQCGVRGGCGGGGQWRGEKERADVLAWGVLLLLYFGSGSGSGSVPISGTNAARREESGFELGLGKDVTDDLESRGNSNRRPKHHSDFSYCLYRMHFQELKAREESGFWQLGGSLSSSLPPFPFRSGPSTFPSPQDSPSLFAPNTSPYPYSSRPRRQAHS